MWPIWELTSSSVNSWYILHSADLWIHQQQAYILYGYLLTEPLYETIRLVSNIILLTAMSLLVWKDLNMRLTKPFVWLYVSNGFSLVLSLLLLFFTGLYIALVVIWIGFSDARGIQDIAHGKLSFELAFVAFQFVFAFFIMAGSAAAAFYGSIKIRQFPRYVYLLRNFAMSLLLFFLYG